MLELFTIKAIENYSGENKLWDSLRYVMVYIADNVEDEKFQLIDPGNSNNNVLSSMTAEKREILARTMRRIVRNIDDDANSMELYFPINKNYQKKDISYGNKSGGSGLSYPPSGQRFGE